MTEPKVRCLICGKECDGNCEDAYLHMLKTGHNNWELVMENSEVVKGNELG